MENEKMIVKAYLKVTPKQWEKIKNKYAVENESRIINNSKRVKRRCDDCGAYCPCTSYEGYCCENEDLVAGCDTCDEWHEF